MLGGRASRNVMLTLLGAGVVGGGMWGAFGGSDCDTKRYPTRESCEVARGAGQCRAATAEPGGPWRAANCPSHYSPRYYSGWWGGSRGYAYGGDSVGSLPRSRSGGAVDAPGPSRSGSPGVSQRGGFGSSGRSFSGGS